nr:retrovirus-related Pol polyprotein from transposon TNT 1-94 [Tanacetum cinerariifolium]
MSFLYVFGALCYPKNDRKDIRKLGAKGDIGFFIGYAADSCAYKIYNRRTKKIIETMNVSFDELSAMGFEQHSSKPGLQRDRSTNLYTINLHDMASASPICLMARASSTKSWLWHQRLSHLNIDTINDLARNDLVAGLPKFKYHKEHLCPSCEQGKSKSASHPPKPVPNSRSKDEAPAVIISFLKRIIVLLQSPVIIIRIDNGTKFKNQVLKVYFDSVGITHQMSSVRTPKQNGVVER